MNKHGDICFSWEGELLTLIVKGPFNEEGFDYYISLIRKSVLNRSINHWKRLEIWDDEVMASPNVVDKCRVIHDWYEKNGCILSAVVVSNNMQALLLKKSVKTNAEIFTKIEDSKEWFKRQSAKAVK
ncbi:hypothetical protein [Psychromonas sp. MME2]|uniref:hypothetical protein n=1 Tax=unclassified Psychromonas TaxID=2614957 RepID=UPI00339D114C